jgi:hypothetical protein
VTGLPTLQTIIGELTHKRTRNSKHYLLSDGSYQAVIFSHDIHYEDENGNLQNIDTDLYDEADFDVMEFPVSKHKCDSFRTRRQMVVGAKQKGVLDREKFDFHALRVPFAATIPRNFRKGYSIGKGENKLTFKPVGASVSVGRLNEDKRNEVEYQDAWNDVDVRLELTERGIKETLILKTDKAPTEFSFQVEGNIADDLTAGELLLENAWLEDAAGVRRDVHQTVRRENGKVFVDIFIDVTGLTFPVIVDPTTTIQPGPEGKDTYTDSIYYNTSFGNEGSLYAGKFDTQFGWSYRKTLIEFPLSSIPTDAVVLQASLELHAWNVYGSDFHRTLFIYRITTPWTEDITANKWIGTSSTGISFLPVMGWNRIDVTSLVKDWVNGTYPNYGMSIDTYKDYDTEYGAIFESSDNNNPSVRPKLVVTYNRLPTAPIVTSPNGGETWNAQHTITWTPASDPDGDPLRYQIQLTTDGGSTWKDIVSLTPEGATSYTYNFTSEPETSTARIRIRAYDGNNYGPWDESNGVFSIKHNVAPTAPTNLSPSGGTSVNRAATIRLSWKHNDPNSNDPQSKFDLQWRPVGGATWNTVTQATPNQFWDAPAGTFPRGGIEWRVRTYDQEGLSGPYSDQALFFAGDKPATPTIIRPANGSTVPIAWPTLQWSSADQVAYQTQVLNMANAVLWDTGEVSSSNKAVTIDYDLVNNTQYKLRVRIKNADGLWSDWDTVTITVSYTPPAVPTLTITNDEANGRIQIAVTNPTPQGTEPTVISNELYRRKIGEMTWTRIKIGIPNSGIYDDYAAASGVTYEYMARAWGDNGTFTDSLPYPGHITLKGVWLHCIDDPTGTVHRFALSSGNSDEWRTDGSLMKFAGRKRPVAVFGENEDGRVTANLQMLRNRGDREALQNIVQRKTPVCYRDNRGRKMFGVIFQLPSNDTFYGYTVSVSIDEIDYKEEV